MFDIGADELLLTAIVAIVVIGPKDLPRALRTAGRWVGKMRRVSNAFRAGIDNVIREAEIQEMEQKWREHNAAIMAAHPNVAPDTAAPAAADTPAVGPSAPAAGTAPVAPAVSGPSSAPANPSPPGADS